MVSLALGLQWGHFWPVVRHGGRPALQHHRMSPALNAALSEGKNPSAKELVESSKGQPGLWVSFVCMKFSPGNVIRISQFKGFWKSSYLWVIVGADRCFCQKLDPWTA